MVAPEEFAAWLTGHAHKDKKLGWIYRYHSRSDSHSIALCQFILKDLLHASPILREKALANRLIYRINCRHTFPNGKQKTLDLAVGTPKIVSESARFADTIMTGEIDRVLMSCEAKTVMTEHGKSQPRVFDELGSSHEIVHQGDREAIAAGITVVNIASTFVSPLRQKNSDQLHVSQHKQPHAAQRMIQHLRGLPIWDSSEGTGFDAYATIVVDCDNQGPASLWTESPAPQPGDRDHYDRFINQIVAAFAVRFD
ncbi:MAG TPA: hypothetical protein VMM76_01020 [Pirellulaceae bacterium]|nr:hypothetical protein [Pirellulaceae bacterium]